MGGRKVLTREDALLLMGDALLKDESSLRREFNRRSKDVEQAKVPLSDVEHHLAKGWTPYKRFKTTAALRRPKRASAQLEDDVWCMFRRAGYWELNGKSFYVPYERDDGTLDRKEVDVFARDDETVLVVECKTMAKRGRRSLQKDLAETKAFKGQMASAIRAYYGESFRPKIVWIYATRNIIWSEPDVARAAEISVQIITENEFSYFDAFLRHIGPAGRFQILAELLEGQKIPELDGIKVPAIRGKLGGARYYAFVTTPAHLLKISFVNHLALNHPDGRPAYQRMIKHNRLKAIGSFIANGGFFPTNILVNFVEECRFDLLSNKDSDEETVRFGWLTLPSRYKSAWIIDGQHRLYGYSFLDKTHWQQNIFVLAFEKLDHRKEAELFITINHEQKSVPKSILVSLQADLKWGSEDSKDRLAALTSATVKSLAADATGPLGQRFVVEGVSPAETQSLTIPEVAKGIDRSRLLGRVVNGRYVPGPLAWRTDDETIARCRAVVNGYFESLRLANPTRWEAGRSGYVATNPGVRAHLQLLAEIISDLEVREFHVETAPAAAVVEAVGPYLIEVLKAVREYSDEEMKATFGRKFGEGGVRDYFFSLCEMVCTARPGFGPQEFKEYVEARSDSRYESAHADVNKLAKEIFDYVFDVLVHAYGVERLPGGDEAFWERGIDNARAKSDAYQKRLQDSPDKRLHKFAYLDLLAVRDIVRQQSNWHLFEDVFNLQMPEEQKGKKYYLQWMEEFNEVRRIPGHPSKLRVYRNADYEFIDWLKEQFYPRLLAARKRLRTQ